MASRASGVVLYRFQVYFESCSETLEFGSLVVMVHRQGALKRTKAAQEMTVAAWRRASILSAIPTKEHPALPTYGNGATAAIIASILSAVASLSGGACVY
jgi:hypothetical protein